MLRFELDRLEKCSLRTKGFVSMVTNQGDHSKTYLLSFSSLSLCIKSRYFRENRVLLCSALGKRAGWVSERDIPASAKVLLYLV